MADRSLSETPVRPRLASPTTALVLGGLWHVVERTVHPAHVSLWIRGPRPPVGG